MLGEVNSRFLFYLTIISILIRRSEIKISGPAIATQKLSLIRYVLFLSSVHFARTALSTYPH